MQEKIKKSKELIQSLNNLIDSNNPKYYHYMSSINSLEINNDIIEEFLKKCERELTIAESLTRIMGLLNSLINSLDALYSICYIITNGKNLINLNQNRQMRELKYIRNIVINHPVEDSFNNDKIGTCIIKRDKVTAKTFKYYIYFNKEIKAREIKLLDMINAYYDESISAMERFLNYKEINIEPVLNQIKKTYRKFSNDLDIREDILELRGVYLRNSNVLANKEVRYIWRVEVLMKFSSYNKKDKEVKEIFDYCMANQLEKIYSCILPFDYIKQKDDLVNDKKLPKAINQFFKLIEKNDTLDTIIPYLWDMNHPLFVAALKKCIDYVTDAGLDSAKKYFELIKDAHEANDADIVYCLACILNNRKK